MIEAGELDVARDECRWLLDGCSECLEAHRMLGEIALEEEDLALARGHFGYAYRMGIAALDRASVAGPLPYELLANRSFFESAKGLAWCLLRLGKRELAVEVVERVLTCDPSDPLTDPGFAGRYAGGIAARGSRQLRARASSRAGRRLRPCPA